MAYQGITSSAKSFARLLFRFFHLIILVLLACSYLLEWSGILSFILGSCAGVALLAPALNSIFDIIMPAKLKEPLTEFEQEITPTLEKIHQHFVKYGSETGYNSIERDAFMLIWTNKDDSCLSLFVKDSPKQVFFHRTWIGWKLGSSYSGVTEDDVRLVLKSLSTL